MGAFGVVFGITMQAYLPSLAQDEGKKDRPVDKVKIPPLSYQHHVGNLLEIVGSSKEILQVVHRSGLLAQRGQADQDRLNT